MQELIKHIKKVELDPEKRYLLLLDEKYFDKEMVKGFAYSLKNFGFQVLVGAVPSLNGIKIIEEPNANSQ